MGALVMHWGVVVLLALATAALATSTCGPDKDHVNSTAKPISALTWTLYKKIVSKNENKNILFSPASIFLALALVEPGSGGRTQQQLKNILLSSETQGLVGDYYQSLTRQLKIDSDNTILRTANGIWHGESVTLKTEYSTKMTQCFGAAIKKTNFANTEAARGEINSWVSEKTASKIPELIKRGVITAQTTAVLINALYLKAPWREAFRTANAQFHALGESQPQQVKFMVDRGFYRFGENEDAQMLAIPYKNTDLVFYVVKAKAANAGIGSIESRLSPEAIRSLARSATGQKVDFKIPAFTIRLSTSLKQILRDAGLDALFSNSDFSRMTASGTMQVDEVLHEAFIKVNENGTEAAAATALLMAGASPSSRPKEFVADRPFMFFIMHAPTKTALFVGKVNKIENN